jgi:hypothetical protein
MQILNKLFFFVFDSIITCFGLSVFFNYPCTRSPPLPRIIESTLYLFIEINNRGNVTNKTGGDYVIFVRDLVLLASFIRVVQTRT